MSHSSRPNTRGGSASSRAPTPVDSGPSRLSERGIKRLAADLAEGDIIGSVFNFHPGCCDERPHIRFVQISSESISEARMLVESGRWFRVCTSGEWKDSHITPPEDAT